MKLIEILKVKRYTPMALSKILCVVPQTVYRWANGKCEPNATTILKLAEILDVSEKEILECFKKEA